MYGLLSYLFHSFSGLFLQAGFLLGGTWLGWQSRWRKTVFSALFFCYLLSTPLFSEIIYLPFVEKEPHLYHRYDAAFVLGGSLKVNSNRICLVRSKRRPLYRGGSVVSSGPSGKARFCRSAGLVEGDFL